MVLASTEESFKHFKTNRVVVNSKNPHPNRKTISGTIITDRSNGMSLHSHGERREKGVG